MTVQTVAYGRFRRKLLARAADGQEFTALSLAGSILLRRRTESYRGAKDFVFFRGF
jgi:hypothetical protein